MDLKELLIIEDILAVPGYSAADPFNSGNITMTGNGYLGYRGTFPDWGPDKYSACTVTNTFDLADGKWKELCNVPNGLFFKAECDGEILIIDSDLCLKTDHTLNYRYGLTAGKSLWRLKNGTKISIRWERFASYDDLHLIPQKIELSADRTCEIKISAGIEGEVWSLKGNHFIKRDFEKSGERIIFSGKTTEKKLPIVVGHQLGADISLPESGFQSSEKGIFRQATVEVPKNESVTFNMYMAVYSGNDTIDPQGEMNKSLDIAVEKGFDDLYREHCLIWDAKWEASFVSISGDVLSDRLLRYNMYHNFISTPSHTDTQPIGARGLSCQAYQGAAFWDQEIYNLPMFLFTQPEIARNILIYRYKTLSGAKKKAKDLGYAGAYYAWISGDTGEELCPDYFFKDVLTDRKIRNHFNDWQIHISPDISYTIIKYYETTGDFQFILDYGGEMLLEIAFFLYSRVHYNLYKDCYEILRVLGPDEYHENADNNAFTNNQARYALEKTLEIMQKIEAEEPLRAQSLKEKTGVSDKHLTQMKDIAGKLYIPEADSETGLIEQFDGYFQLEDITPGELKKRLINEQEYWGWPNGIAFETQVMKQADIVQMFVLHDFPVDVMKKNYLYYEPRTQHRSSLSPGVHAIIAAQVGLKDQAYEYFIRSCSVDIANTHPPTSGGTFIGGIHTAACGIAWQIAVRGFAGMKVDEDSLSFSPNLPGNWSRLSFSISYRGTSLRIHIEGENITIKVLEDPSLPLTVHVGGVKRILKERGEIHFGK